MLTPLKAPATQSVLLQSIISGGRVTRRDSVPAMLTTQALDWPGVLVEAGKNDVAAVDDVVGDRHYVSLNVDTQPLTLEVKGSTGFRAFTIPPLGAWVSPGHDPLTMRLNSALRYLRVAIDTAHLGRLMAPSPDDVQPVRLQRTYGVAAPQIARLMLTLRDEADSRNPGGLAVVEAVTTALGHLLVRHAGVERARPLRVRGGLSGVARRPTSICWGYGSSAHGGCSSCAVPNCRTSHSARASPTRLTSPASSSGPTASHRGP